MRGLRLLVTVALCLRAATAQAQFQPIVRLAEAGYPDAKCLDGSSGAYYFRPGVAPAFAPAATRWLWYFEGGGWCTSEDSCLWRSYTQLGSSVNYTTKFGDDPNNWAGGLFDADCTQNALFCQFNLVYVKYCDGNSYAGARDGPLTVQGKPLWFRGAAIRESVIDHLRRTAAFDDATEILVSGCSAGALAAYLHADSFYATAKAVAPQLRRFAAAPASGFFLDHTNYLYQRMYATQMHTIYNLSNASGGLGPTCLERLPPGQRWRCQFAEYAFTHSAVPTFVLNSKTDMAQIPLQFLSFLNGSLVPPYSQECRYTFPFPFHGCFTSDNIQPLLGFEADFVSRVYEVPGFLRPENGFFVSSCWTHCEAQLPQSWNDVTIAGTSMRVAVERWWNGTGLPGAPRRPVEAAPGDAGGITERVHRAAALGGAADGGGYTVGAHGYVDCAWSASPPFFCNPTCPIVP